MKSIVSRVPFTVLVLLTASCNLTGPSQKETCQWFLPADEKIEASYATFTNTRMWVSPNPLVIPVHMGFLETEVKLFRLGGGRGHP